MDLSKAKRWCVFNIILPGMALLTGDNDTYQGPTCHLPAPPPEAEPATSSGRIGSPLFYVILVSAILATAFGIILLIRYQKKKRLLKEQMQKSVITEDQFEILR